MNTTHACVIHFRVAMLVAAVLVLLPWDASAQQMDPNMQMPMSMPMPMLAAKPGSPSKSARKKPAKKHESAVSGAHAKHAGATPVSSAKPVMDHDAMAHDMPMPSNEAQSAQPMDHSAMPGMSMAPTEPMTPIPVLTDADRAAAAPPPGGHTVHDNSIQSYTLFDRLETWNADKGTGFEWEGKTWIGTDLNRVWLRSEGERINGRTESADLEVLYGHSVAAWWDVVAGVRHDFKPGASQDFAAIGVMGMTPYKFEVMATGYIGQSGQTSARLEAEYETLLTNRLILQPLVEVNLFSKDDARRGIGSGLSTVEAGLRLRYELTRRFAPYIGMVRERAFAGTADFRRSAGEDIDDTRFVAGVRIWF